MKNNFLLLVLSLILLFSCNQQEEYTITANIEGEDNKTIYLKVYREGNYETIDSAVIQNNTASFSGSVDHVEPYFVSVEDVNSSFFFFPSNEEITLNLYPDSMDKSTVVGSPAHDEYRLYLTTLQPLENDLEDLYMEYREARTADDENKMEELGEEASTIEDKINDKQWEAFNKNTGNFLAPYILYRKLYYGMELEALDSVYHMVDDRLAGHPYMVQLNNHINTLKNVAIGKQAPDFSLADTAGQVLSLSDLEGDYNYLLVDFWASWCPPCRAENPNLVAVYNEYKDEGFEILGVSFDRDKEAWIEAIHEDSLAWYHVSDLKGWGNKVGKMYGIRSIPSSVILNKDGIIIAKNLRGEALREKMEELYN